MEEQILSRRKRKSKTPPRHLKAEWITPIREIVFVTIICMSQFMNHAAPCYRRQFWNPKSGRTYLVSSSPLHNHWNIYPDRWPTQGSILSQTLLRRQVPSSPRWRDLASIPIKYSLIVAKLSSELAQRSSSRMPLRFWEEHTSRD
jgi:hypothetical protein